MKNIEMAANIEEKDYDHPSCYDDLEIHEKEALDKWVWQKFEKSGKVYWDRTSYGLKHDFQRDTNIYIYNGAFKGAMLAAGFKAADKTELNWNFKVKERLPDSFYGWAINRYKYRDSPLGDLARDMKTDPKFPKLSVDRLEMRGYIIRRHGCKGALKAFDRAWKYYEESMNRLKKIN